jgi:hypothetical protein
MDKVFDENEKPGEEPEDLESEFNNLANSISIDH